MIKRLQERRDEGFTLIELLIVIIILGILATVVIFAVGGIRDRGQENACKTEKKNVETAFEAYLSDNSTLTYPTTLTALTSLKNPSDLQLRWQIQAGTGGLTTAPELTAIGKCDNYNLSDP
jgi:prepilin-type N-terminal cleavage/methylation domain-containing protein